MQPYLQHAGEQINKEKTANMQQKITNFQENQNSFYLNKHHPFHAVKRTHYQIQVLWFQIYMVSSLSSSPHSPLTKLKLLQLREHNQKSDSPKHSLPLGHIHQLKSLPTPLPSNSTIDINGHSANCTLIQPYTLCSQRLHFISNVGMSTLPVSYKIC